MIALIDKYEDINLVKRPKIGDRHGIIWSRIQTIRPKPCETYKKEKKHNSKT